MKKTLLTLVLIASFGPLALMVYGMMKSDIGFAYASGVVWFFAVGYYLIEKWRDRQDCK
jgi:hypothetical protein